jgi:hypothetical protein
MRKHLTTFFWISRLGTGAAFLALFAFTAASRAGIVIVSNLITPIDSTSGHPYMSQEFGTTVSGQINNITLDMHFTSAGSIVVSIYDMGTSSTGAPPSGTGYTLGTITVSGPSAPNGTDYYLNGSDGLASYSLAAGHYYDLVVHVPASAGWEYLTYASGNNSGTGGSFVSPNGAYNSPNGVSWSNSGISTQEREMELDVVPEVPMTGMVMGIGALAIAAGHTLRRKLCAAQSV